MTAALAVAPAVSAATAVTAAAPASPAAGTSPPGPGFGSDGGGNNIRVVCRFRPQNAREIKEGGVPVVSFSDDMTEVKVESKDYPGQFAFDQIFDWNASQKQVFDYTANATIEDVMRGYNGTIFAYGQTGSGKTHTMVGDMESSELKGLTPRLIESVFSRIFQASSNFEFTVKCSYMEIYMERVRDLLNPVNDNLPIHEEKNKGVYVKGLLEVFVGSVDEVYEVLRRGQSARMVAATNMNAESSRSHSILVLQISQKNLEDGSLRTGRLYLVDLAGSEKVGKTGATGQTLEEAKKINKSLSALGMVINCLTDGKSAHIPYRDSKLTRILQESLGGNSRTTLIINASPSSFNEAETISTLRFGMRAKTIKNKAKVNAELSPSELKALLKRNKSELGAMQQYATGLEGEILVWRSGSTVPESDWVVLRGGNGGVPAPSEGPLSALPSHMLSDMRSSGAGAGGRASPLGGVASSVSSLQLDSDERDEFLRRENELSDQLAEKEAALEAQRAAADDAQDELRELRESAQSRADETAALRAQLSEAKLQCEKVAFENQDAAIHLDAVKEQNVELEAELASLRKQLLELQSGSGPLSADAASTASSTAAASPAPSTATAVNRQALKQQMMAQMMAEYVPTADISRKEDALRATLAQLEDMKQNMAPPTDPEAVAEQFRELLELKTRVAKQENVIEELASKAHVSESDLDTLRRRKEEVDARYTQLETEYEEMLQRTIAEDAEHGPPEVQDAIKDIRARMERQEELQRELQDRRVEEIAQSLRVKDAEIRRLQHELEVAQQAAVGAADHAPATMSSAVGDDDDVLAMKRRMTQQLREFDTMKRKLMRDLQDRCEKVVELEISLDETREQYNTVLRTNNSRAQLQKMSFLERNLEQLSRVQKQLVDQNATVKKALGVAERKLVARNERISSLESSLQDVQSKIDRVTQKYEAQLAAMHEKLQTARAFNTPASSSWLYSSRIAKPLRGGGVATATDGLGGAGDGPGGSLGSFGSFGGSEDALDAERSPVDRAGDRSVLGAGAGAVPPLHHPAGSTPSLSSKRSSWYISLLKK